MQVSMYLIFISSLSNDKFEVMVTNFFLIQNVPQLNLCVVLHDTMGIVHKNYK